MTSIESVARLSIYSRNENIELVRGVLEYCFQRWGLEEDSYHWIELAMREAVANAIRHGNNEDPTRLVFIAIDREGDDLILKIRDEGSGFDPGELEDPLAPENILRPGGRGLFFMKRLMDKVEYIHEAEVGSTLVLRKKLQTNDKSRVEEN